MPCCHHVRHELSCSTVKTWFTDGYFCAIIMAMKKMSCIRQDRLITRFVFNSIPDPYMKTRHHLMKIN